jgi:hypothetical protein
MKLLTMVIILLGFGLVAAAEPSPPASADAKPAFPIQWEYRVLTREQVLELGKKDMAAGLNKLGAEGWELVAIEPANVAAKPAELYFKRPAHMLERHVAALKDRVRRAELAVAEQMDHLAWSERMVRAGFLSKRNLEQERDQLRAVESILHHARKELGVADGHAPKTPAKSPKPELD